MTEVNKSGKSTDEAVSSSLTDGKLRPVEVAHLESALAGLWQSAAKTCESGHAVTRASVLTLLAYVDSEADGVETLDLVSKIIHQNPCRAIVMIADPDGRPEGLTAAVSARSRPAPGGGKQICCEEIVLRARGEAVHGLDSVVVPLTIPGLPVYLWWRAGHFSRPNYLRDIFHETDRLVFDSGLLDDPESGLKDLARFMDELSGPNPVTVTDLNWSRLTPWREIIAQSFNSPEGLRRLHAVEEVKIEWSIGSNGEGPARSARALLLATWLGGRLGWKPNASSRRAHGIREIFFDTGSKTARVELHRKSAAVEGAAFSVQIISGEQSPASFAFQEVGNNIQARVEAAGQSSTERAILLPAMSEERLMHEEIRHSARDVIYEEALGVVAKLATI